jgi:hypothetical protein
VFTGWQFNVTDTASDTNSMVFKFGVGGTYYTTMRKDGLFSSRLVQAYDESSCLVPGDAVTGNINQGLDLASGSSIAWGNDTAWWKTKDVTLARLSAGVLGLNGVALYNNIPQNSQSVDYGIVIGDAAKHIYETGASKTITIPANGSVAFPIGTVITFVSASNSVSIAITTDTLILAGTGATGTRTLAANSIATALKITSTSWIISGTGIS